MLDTTPWMIPSTLTLAQADGAGEPVRGVLGAEGGPGSESQPAGPDGASGAGASPASGLFGNMFLPIMIGVLLLMVFTTMSSGRRQKKERAALMDSLGKHDRVQTSGGIIGTIMEMSDDSVVLRVDEASNTRIRFAKSAILQVHHSAGKGPSESVDAEEIIEEPVHA